MSIAMQKPKGCKRYQRTGAVAQARSSMTLAVENR